MVIHLHNAMQIGTASVHLKKELTHFLPQTIYTDPTAFNLVLNSATFYLNKHSNHSSRW